MRPVTSQVAAEIGYDPAGRDRSRAPSPSRSPNAFTPQTPRWGRRINSTGPISDDTVAYRVGDLPSSTPSASISYSPPIPPTGGVSHYIPAYPGISRYIPVYLGSFFLFAGTKAAAPGKGKEVDAFQVAAGPNAGHT